MHDTGIYYYYYLYVILFILIDLIRKGRFAFAKKLIEIYVCDLDLNSSDNSGRTILHWTCTQERYVISITCMQFYNGKSNCKCSNACDSWKLRLHD